MKKVIQSSEFYRNFSIIGKVKRTTYSNDTLIIDDNTSIILKVIPPN